jgi:hypothetical protein
VGPILDDLEVVDGAAAGAWIAPRLEGGFGGHVKQQVPNGYDAYGRIFHPATDADGNPTTWAEVARSFGRTAHREMQWHKLVGVDDTFGESGPGDWPGAEPETGELEKAQLGALRNLLQAYTQNPDRCFFGLSTIYGGVEGTYPEARQLRQPGRDFVIFVGPLSAIDQLGYDGSKGATIVFSTSPASATSMDASERWWSQTPNLVWPADHSWFVSSEYDFDSTLLGGSRDLVDAIKTAAEMEAWEVERGDSLEIDADKIN